ncbi:ion channel [Paenibacillus sp. P36]|uniref:ion channel n=1 Tax=Paenibacillus sp. P36 TaxID=3342538 RepID=UPI0038B36FF1
MIFFTKILMRVIRMNTKFIFILSVIFIGCSALLSYELEPETFENRFNGLWWVMTTVTTVGYGDYYPHTIAGKCLGMVIYFFGIGLVSVVISKVIDSLFIYTRMKEEGKLRYSGQNHFVIIDWSNHAENAIKEILNTDPISEVVLIDTLEKAPLQHDRVHYVQGNPQQLTTLEMANVSKARAVFIFADEITRYDNTIRDPSFIDGKTLLVASTIERNYNHVYTIVEIRDKENLMNFQHMQIDEFIFGSETISQLAVRAAFNPGSSKILTQLLTRTYGQDLYEISKDIHWLTFHDAFQDLLSKGATLISDGGNLTINKRLHENIPDNARLFVICDKETYRQLTISSASNRL